MTAIAHYVPEVSTDCDRSHDQTVQDALDALRRHLRMDVAFVGEFDQGRRVFRHVAAEPGGTPIEPGDSDPLEASYCQRAVDGRLPLLIPDAGDFPEAMALPVTETLGIGAYLTCPIRLEDGRVYGTLCCFSASPDSSLNERDMDVLNMFGAFVGTQIQRRLADREEERAMAERVSRMLASRDYRTLYQPIYDFAKGRVLGYEALTRFGGAPGRGADVWFAEARTAGLGEELEVAAAEQAVKAFAELPRESYMSLNFSPEHLLSGAAVPLLAAAPLARTVLELTEHESIPDYGRITSGLAPLREQGLRLAVDDAGAGFASFRHILKLEPDYIKLDISLTRGIDSDPAKRALAAAFIGFAHETGSEIIAEGVETEAELESLRAMGAHKVQGNLVGRPMALDEIRPRSRAAG
jgi:EAL domain-containing protein (putative c-di-GMP-specific phosphodiesterase class I)